MSSGQIAIRYANALLQLGNEKGIAKDLYADAQLLSESFAENSQFVELLSDPSSSIAQKVDALKKSLAGRVNSVLIDFLVVMVQKHRADYSYNALLLFIHQYRMQNNILEVKVESAKVLGERELERITQYITTTYKKTVELTAEVNPELVAGIVIIVDGKMVDLSVAGQLKNVRKALGVS